MAPLPKMPDNTRRFIDQLGKALVKRLPDSYRYTGIDRYAYLTFTRDNADGSCNRVVYPGHNWDTPEFRGTQYDWKHPVATHNFPIITEYVVAMREAYPHLFGGQTSDADDDKVPF